MRLPRYRQWSREGTWHYWGVISVDPYVFIPPRDPRVYNVEHPALSQMSTDIKDTNGVEIFEGDVIRTFPSPGSQGIDKLVTFRLSAHGLGFNIGTAHVVKRIVIGNHHEGVNI
jgi:hypothetical protein